MQDGMNQTGAGPSDMRLAGKDLQHNRQTRTADENASGVTSAYKVQSGAGGPIKEALDAELARHKQSKAMRLEHLENHYKR